MSDRSIKKLRRWYRHDVQAKIQREVGIMARALKPKPRWIPEWLWRRIVRLVLTIPE